MIIGEGQILGQVRTAWLSAEECGSTGSLISRAFRHAVEVGKRARTETGIARHAVSVSSAAVQVAADRLGSLEGRRVLLIGAGEVSEGMAVALAGAGVAEIVVANRSQARGRELAQRFGGRSVSLDEMLETLVTCDVLLTSTDAPGTLIERSEMEEVIRRRDGRALLVVDVAVPRDVDPGAGQVFGVTLLDIDDLKAIGEQSLETRRGEVGRVREIITEELERFRVETLAREIAPTITALRARADDIRASEIEQAQARLAELDPAAAALVEQITNSVVNKLLHEPTMRLKEASGTDQGDIYADALVALFALDEDLPSPEA